MNIAAYTTGMADAAKLIEDPDLEAFDRRPLSVTQPSITSYMMGVFAGLHQYIGSLRADLDLAFPAHAPGIESAIEQFSELAADFADMYF